MYSYATSVLSLSYVFMIVGSQTHNYIFFSTGGQILLSKLQQFQPRIAVFNGKGIYEIFSGKKEFVFGRQPERIEGTRTVSIQ